MFSVIFEVLPKEGHSEQYLAFAKLLKPEIEKIDGFIDNERFASRREAGRVLSLSTWRDEKALIRWRTLAVHHEIQVKGRLEVFADYHLRVGEVVADSHVPGGQVLREQRFDETEIGAAQVATLIEIPPDAQSKPAEDVAGVETPAAGSTGLVDVTLFESIYTPGKLLILASWRDESALAGYARVNEDGAIRRRTVRVIRDYGMFERREAPQYYPEAIKA